MEKWVVSAKRADFQAIAEKFGIDQVTARLIRNRDIVGEPEIRQYLYGTKEDFYDPHLLKDADKLVEILMSKIKEQKKIRIIGDYDERTASLSCQCRCGDPGPYERRLWHQRTPDPLCI